MKSIGNKSNVDELNRKKEEIEIPPPLCEQYSTKLATSIYFAHFYIILTGN